MDLAHYHTFCMRQPGAALTFPFDEGTAVYKVAGKIFTLAPTDPFDRVNVKCDPALAETLRATYEGVLPGYHMSKKHWNTLLLGHDLTTKQVLAMVKASYALVVAGLPIKKRALLPL